MKSFTPYVETQRYAARQNVVWLLTLGEGNEVWRAASREIEFDGAMYPARIADAPRWSMSSAGAFGAGGIIESRAEIRVNDLASSADSLRSRLGLSGGGLAAELKLLWTDAEGLWQPEDAVTMLRGIVSEWTAGATSIRLMLRDEIAAVSQKRIGRTLLPFMLGGQSSPILGRDLPILFGLHEAAPLLELSPGVASRLAAPLRVEDATIALASMEGFPVSGTVQVGAELIEYSAMDSVAKTLGTALVPINRGAERMLHSSGEPVRLVPEGGFQWLVADHPCASVSDLRADGLPVDSGDWSASLRTLGGFEAQVITMPRWPTRLRHESSVRTRAATELFGENIHSIAATNTAVDPAFAIDGRRTSTAARLKSGALRLAIDLDTRAGTEGNILGLWQGAKLRLRYSATRRWNPGSKLWLRFTRGTTTHQATVPIPLDIEGLGIVKTASGDSTDAVQTPIGIHDFELDLTSAIDAALGWDAFSGSPARIEVEFVPSGDFTEILVHEVELLVRFFARLNAEQARTITARVEGWPDHDTGLAVANPADVISALLTRERFASIAIDRLDAASLAEVRTELAAEGFAFARRIEGGPDLGGLIRDATSEASVWVRCGGGTIGFARAGASPSMGGASERLDDAKALREKFELQLGAPDEAAPADCLILTVPARDGNRVGVWNRCTNGMEEDGHISERRILHWLDGRSADALTALGDRVQALERERWIEFEQAYPLGAAMLEPGDSVAVQSEPLGLLEVPARVEAISLRDPSRVHLRMRGPQAGEICWQHDSLTFLRAMDYGRRIVLFVGGHAALSLETDGWLRLRGKLRENASFPAPPLSAAIGVVSGWVMLGSGSGSGFVPFLRIDADGNAELNGELREQSAISFTSGEECHEAGEGWFRMSLRGTGTCFEFRSDGARLHLKGIVSESVNLRHAETVAPQKKGKRP